MDVDLERIRLRAYEIWESEGRRGDPMEHWLRAEREVRPGPGAGATVESARPADAAAALEAITAAQAAPKKRAAAKAPATQASATQAPAATKPATKSSAKASAGTEPALPAAATAAPRAAKATRSAARKEP